MKGDTALLAPQCLLGTDHQQFKRPPCHQGRLQPYGHYHVPTCYGRARFGRAIFPMFHAESEESEKIMFGLVMVFILVLTTVATPFAVMATVKAKPRRK